MEVSSNMFRLVLTLALLLGVSAFDKVNFAQKLELSSNKLSDLPEADGMVPNTKYEEEEREMILNELLEREQHRSLRRMGKKRVSNEDDVNSNSPSSDASSSATASSYSSSGSDTETSTESSSSSQQGTCPAGNPKGNLRVVSDITKETDHVELIVDSHLPRRFNSPPKVFF
jgi:hypothetical protein